MIVATYPPSRHRAAHTLNSLRCRVANMTPALKFTGDDAFFLPRPLASITGVLQLHTALASTGRSASKSNSAHGRPWKPCVATVLPFSAAPRSSPKNCSKPPASNARIYHCALSPWAAA